LAKRLVRDLRPAAVFGLGGFAAAPVVLAAAAAGVRTCLLSIDALPGLANRRLAGKVDVIFAQFETTAAAYGRRGEKVRVVGCPVRAELAEASADEARRAFGLRDDRKTLLVMAGSLGAANINQALAALRGDLEALADDWQLLHLTGPGKLDEVRAAWAGAAIHHVAMEFCDRMGLAYAAAELALARAGAATVGELAATATPAALMPYPHHRDRHQDRNAAALVAAGSAVVVEDAGAAAANAAALRGALLPILLRPKRLSALSTAAAGAARTDAAAEIARWLGG
jgi:UDP-N-acetylglucosamine--N-acetylmuramyl-(pentapeptide) pyrophosphoryl-undecaprenol N-acetylglucosamine transferase